MGREAFEAVTTAVCERRSWKWDGQQIEVHLDGGRRQAVHLDYFSHQGHELVRLHSLIGPTKRIKPERLVHALEMNFSMPHGSMAVKDGMLVLVQTLMLAEADDDEVDQSVTFLAETADHYERSMFGPDAY